MVVRWANDIGTWVVDLAIEIGDEIYSLANQAIADMKDAYHLIGGFFHALGADIDTALDWLKHNVLELLADTKINAAVIESWLGQLPTEARTVVQGIEFSADHFFTTKQQEFDSAITEAATAVEAMTFGTSAPLPPPKTDTGSSSAEADLAKDMGEIGKVLNDLPGTWLLDKLMKCLGNHSTANTTIDDLQQPIDALANDFQAQIDVASSFGSLVGETATTFGNRNDFTAQSMSDWFAAIQKLIDSVLTLADVIVDSVLELLSTVLTDLDDVLTTYTIDFDSALGPLLTAILDQAKIDLNMTTAHLIGLVIGFPASLIGQIRGLSSLFPTSAYSAEQHKALTQQRHTTNGRRAVGSSEPSWLVGLGIGAAVTQGIWGLNDIVVDLASLDGEESFTAPAACQWIDIIAPLALVALQWPTQSGNNEPIEPFSNGLRNTGPNDWMLVWTTLTAVIPPLFDLAVLLKPAGSGTTSPSPEGTTDPMAEFYSPIVQGMAALPNTVLGSVYCSRTGAGSSAIAATVLGNLSYNFALLLTTWVEESTDDLSTGVKTLIDAAGNLGAAIAIAEATTLPPK